MWRTVIVIGLFALVLNEPGFSIAFAAAAEPKANPEDASYETILREVRQGHLSKEESRRVLPSLLDTYLQRHDNRLLIAIRTIRQNDPGAIDSIAPRIVQVIRDSENQTVLADIYDMLIGMDSIPPTVVSAVKQRVAQRNEKHVTLPDIDAVAVLLKLEPAVSENRKWLEKLLAHKSATIRMAAANALGRTGEAARKSLPLLGDLAIRDKSSAVRVVAAGALWRIDRDPKPAVPVLVEAIGKEGEAVVLRPQGVSEWCPNQRHLAAHLLGEIKVSGQGVVGVLMSVLDEKNDLLLRVTAIKSLGEIGYRGDEVVKALDALRKDPNEAVSEAAKEAVHKVKMKSGVEIR